jgi:hypothetical protein
LLEEETAAPPAELVFAPIVDDGAVELLLCGEGDDDDIGELVLLLLVISFDFFFFCLRITLGVFLKKIIFRTYRKN